MGIGSAELHFDAENEDGVRFRVGEAAEYRLDIPDVVSAASECETIATSAAADETAQTTLFRRAANRSPVEMVLPSRLKGSLREIPGKIACFQNTPFEPPTTPFDNRIPPFESDIPPYETGHGLKRSSSFLIAASVAIRVIHG